MYDNANNILILPFTSQNLLHNYLIFKQFINYIKHIIFLYPDQDERYLQNFINLLINEQKQNQITIDQFLIYPHSIEDTQKTIREKIHPLIQKLNCDYLLVNLSCKNEIISIILFNEFNSLYPQYHPYSVLPSKNLFIRLHPNIISKNFSFQITLKDFFFLHGYSYDDNNNYSIPNDCPQPYERLNDYISAEQTDHTFINNNSNFTPNQKEYLTGGWLEKFIYDKIKDIKSIPDKRMGLKVKIKNFINPYNTHYLNDANNNDHEIDISFIHNNHLYIIECKAHFEHQKLYDAMYKIASIQKLFPDNVKSYIFSLTRFSPEIGNIEKEILTRKKNILKITDIAPLNIIREQRRLENFINTMFEKT